MSGNAVILGTVYPFRFSQARLSPSPTQDCTYFSLGDSAVPNCLQTDSADKDKIEDSEVLSVNNFYLAKTNYPCDDMTEVVYLEAPFERHVNCDKEIPHDKRNVHFQAQNKDNGDTLRQTTISKANIPKRIFMSLTMSTTIYKAKIQINLFMSLSVPCALPSKNKDENFYEFNNGHCDLHIGNAKEHFHKLSNIHNNLHRENAQETAHESGNVCCQINEILHEEEIFDSDNEVANSYLNHNATETILGENTVHFGPTLAYDKNDAITEVLQSDSLRFGEKLSSGQFLKADSEETNVTPHEGKFQITRKDDNDFQLTQFATSVPQGDGEHSADMSNPDQVRQESVTPPISTQLGDQFPADFPPTERSLGSADTLVSSTPTFAESHIAGENSEQHNSHINAMDSKVRLPSG